jgi:hypothetical protein
LARVCMAITKKVGGMKSKTLLSYFAVLGVVAVQYSCASENGSPFPSRFLITGPNKFEFMATGTFIYPATTKSGEVERLTWLSGYISQHHICPAGYDITAREVDLSNLSPKHAEQDNLSIKYLGECKV